MGGSLELHRKGSLTSKILLKNNARLRKDLKNKLRAPPGLNPPQYRNRNYRILE